MSLKEVSGIDQHRVIDTIFEAGWSRGEDLGDLPTLISLVEQQNIDGEYLSRQVSQPDVKKLLINETAMAIEKGVFGVPSIIIDGNLFWGNDQMEHIELLLAGNDPLDREKLNAQVARPRAIDRKAFKKLNTDK
jgi:2-hydroxychromene-2-carboxylate isomerase